MALPASAITYGTPTGADFSNVGAMVVPVTIPVLDEDGDPVVENGDPVTETVLVQWCTGTLIDEDVVLTAAHCLLGVDTLYFSFANPLPMDARGFVLPGNHLLDGTGVPHEDAFSGGGDWKDIGVILLEHEVSGIQPAELPELNQLGDMSKQELKSTRFTAVGYGALRTTPQGGWQGLQPPDGIRYQASQSALSLTKPWLTLSMNPATGNAGTCYGDSGGPHFFPDGVTIASITVTGDTWCKATDKTYRVDTAFSLEFIAEFID